MPLTTFPEVPVAHGATNELDVPGLVRCLGRVRGVQRGLWREVGAVVLLLDACTVARDTLVGGTLTWSTQALAGLTLLGIGAAVTRHVNERVRNAVVAHRGEGAVAC